MKREVIVTGKTIEEAVEAAVRELGAPSAEKISYTVLEEPKRGLFGIGAAPAKISATYTAGGAEVALEFVKKIVADMGIEAAVRLEDRGEGDVRINIEGNGVGVLIGHHGETLDALQYLANLAANRKGSGERREYVKITLDVEGYRAKREEALRALARRMAERVLKYKKSVMLEPMNPYERRIIHSEVQLIEGVSTNSIGSENNRKVVLYLDEKGIRAGKKTASKKKEDIADED
ncbi:MAG TPA: protein jag [Clostridiales bacterium]|nr:protein jag [Clostridiales bacterium]